MVKKSQAVPRREDSLSRERIIEASIALLDGSGENGLTFRALAERLATGAGAIYWHVANKNDLLTAASDAIVAQTLAACQIGAAPQEAIRAIALGLFDAIDAHPWVGSALMRAPRELPMVRILERIGQQINRLGVPAAAQWPAVSALLHYAFGVAVQNAANGSWAIAHAIERDNFLDEVAAGWSGLDAEQYPFTRSMAAQLRIHDDRADFLAGIDFILCGIEASLARSR